MGNTGTEAVKQQINAEFERRKKSVYGLCVYYAGLVLRHFRTRQAGNTYWENRTNLAMDTVFSGAFKEGEDVLGFFLAHTMEYGVYLELANNRQNEALRPIINEYLPQFKKHLERLYTR